MKTLINFFSLFLMLFTVVGCNDDDNNELILDSKWEVESISDNECISVTNNTSEVFLPPIIYVNAWYKEGSVILKCLSHEIFFSLTAPNDDYISPEGHFSITKIDKQTLKIEFEHDSSGKQSYSEEIKIYGTNEKTMITFLQINAPLGNLNLNLINQYAMNVIWTLITPIIILALCANNAYASVQDAPNEVTISGTLSVIYIETENRTPIISNVESTGKCKITQSFCKT